jgi:hypothetical protein
MPDLKGRFRLSPLLLWCFSRRSGQRNPVTPRQFSQEDGLLAELQDGCRFPANVLKRYLFSDSLPGSVRNAARDDRDYPAIRVTQEKRPIVKPVQHSLEAQGLAACVSGFDEVIDRELTTCQQKLQIDENLVPLFDDEPQNQVLRQVRRSVITGGAGGLSTNRKENAQNE